MKEFPGSTEEIPRIDQSNCAIYNYQAQRVVSEVRLLSCLMFLPVGDRGKADI